MQLINYPFEKAQTFGQNESVIVVVDALLVSTHNLEMIKVSSSKVKQAVIYALEDRLLHASNTLSFFTHSTETGYQALVMTTEVFNQIKYAVKSLNTQHVTTVIEFMRLPIVVDKISYIEQDDIVLYRSGELYGGKLNKEIFFQLHQEKDLQAATLGNNQAEFDLFKVSMWQKHAKQLQQYKRSIILIGIIFLFSSFNFALQSWRLSSQLDYQKIYNQTLFERTFPSVKKIVDLPVQLEQQLKKVNRQQQILNGDLLTAMSKYNFSKNTQRIEFKDGKLTVETLND